MTINGQCFRPHAGLSNPAKQALERLDSRQARVIELRYFAGLSLEDTAEAVKVSVGSADFWCQSPSSTRLCRRRRCQRQLSISWSYVARSRKAELTAKTRQTQAVPP